MTTEGPQNSLDKIEQFILTYFPSDASCYSPKFVSNQEEKSFKSPPFVFLPGHRFLIAKFIDDVKARHTLNSKLSRKRPTVIDTVNNSSPSYTAAKKSEDCVHHCRGTHR